MAEVENRLAHFRRLSGLSAIKLAAAAGVNRQTIYAIEANSYVPNTTVALRLARTLNTTVEELFALDPSDSPIKTRIEPARRLPDSSRPSPGDPLELCKVNNQLMALTLGSVPWCFPAVDGTVRAQSPHGALTVDILDDQSKFDDRILVAGCDPGISILTRHAQASGIKLVVAHRNSSQALALLKARCIHIAGTHLKDALTGESNLPQVSRLFSNQQPAVIAFATWQQGIVTARGNPKNIQTIADFARPDLRGTNRERGSGTRLLLDRELKRLGIKSKQVNGYRNELTGHLASAWQIQSGLSDCCLATGSAARLFGLHFIPLTTERYDFVIARENLRLTRIQHLLNVLAQQSFRRELSATGGYDTGVTAQRML